MASQSPARIENEIQDPKAAATIYIMFIVTQLMSNLRRQMLQMISKYLALLTLGGPGPCHTRDN